MAVRAQQQAESRCDAPPSNSLMSQRPPRLSAFDSRPAGVAASDMQPQHFQAPAPYDSSAQNVTFLTEWKRQVEEREQKYLSRIYKLEWQMKEQRQELEEIRYTVQNDLQTLQGRIEARSPPSAEPSTQLVKHTGRSLPSQETSDAASEENFIKDFTDDKLFLPFRSHDPRHIRVETADAFVDVVIQHTQQFQADRERVDSAHDSQQRAQPTSTGYTCCSIPFANEVDLMSHTQNSHVKSGDVFMAAPTTTAWHPAAIRNLAPRPISGAVACHNETFTWSFLRELIGGEEWSPGYHFNSSRDCMLPSQGYWLVDLTHEPFMPQLPGQHGAKVTAVLNDAPMRPGAIAPDLANYFNTPVFVSADHGKTYRYLGQYSQTRYSDKIGYDTQVEHIPRSVLEYHAEQLARDGRPPWVTWCLKSQLWPKPRYLGPVPTDSACATPGSSDTPGGSSNGLERRVKSGLDYYAQKIKEWEKNTDNMVKLLYGKEGVANILRSYDTDDMQGGLRLWWEYLECVDYDSEFYEMLVKFKAHENSKNPRISRGSQPTPTFAKIEQNGMHGGKATAADSTNDSRGSRYHEATTWDISEYKKVPNPVYLDKAKKLQRQLEHEYPGEDVTNKTTTFVSTIHFDADEPNQPTAMLNAGGSQHMQGNVEKAASLQPRVLKPKNRFPPHLRKMIHGTMPLSRSSTAPVTKEGTAKNNTTNELIESPATKDTTEWQNIDKKMSEVKTSTPSKNKIGKQADKPANPFLQDGKGDLEEAKSFSKEATTAGRKVRNTGKSSPPYLRGK